MDYAKESLRLHEERKGTIEATAAVPLKSTDGLPLACTPGAARL